MALDLTLGKPRPAFIAALILAIIVGGGIAADRFGIITLPGPSHELVASVLPGAVVALTNSERQGNSLPALTANPLLTRAAQMKADDMAAKSYYSHVSPDGTIPPAWLTAVGYKYQMMGENLVIDRESSDDVVSAWMGSEAHRENILNPGFTEIGIGVANGSYKGRDTIYVVQMLAKPFAQSGVAVAPKKEIPTEKLPAPTPIQTPAPVPVPTPAPKPALPVIKVTLPEPKPVKTAATTTIVVRPPAPTTVITDVIRPLLDTVVATDTLANVPDVVASTSYAQPALGVSVSLPAVNLSPAATTTVLAPRETLGSRLQALVSVVALEIKSFFRF